MRFECNRQSRNWSRIAALCLAGGLMLRYFVFPATPVGTDLVHFTSGLLLGISLVLNLSVTQLRKRRFGYPAN